MPITSIEVPVTPIVIEKEFTKVTKRFKNLEKTLKSMSVDWGKISKQAISSTKEIQAISDTAKIFSSKLSHSTVSVVKDLEGLNKKLNSAMQRASDLGTAFGSASSKSEKDEITKEAKELSDTISGLTSDIQKYGSANSESLKSIRKLSKAQDDQVKTLKKAANFDMGDVFGGIKDKIASGDFKGIFSSVGSNLKKGVLGGIARGGIDKASKAPGGIMSKGGVDQMDKAAGKMKLAAMGITLAVAGFALFVKTVANASSHMTALNKTMLSGTGFARDMINGADDYRKTIDDIRSSTIATSESFLKFGKLGKSDERMKVFNAYIKETTGSFTQFSSEMERGGGDLQTGLSTFSRNAIGYGMALGIEITEVGEMMGKLRMEVGYGAGQIQGLMENVVKAANTASMPTTKFMDIFKSVIPNVELYRNRMEELTGTIKMLSKWMNPNSVKAFMNAFASGFKGMSFKERLGHVLVAGVKTTSNILKKDFDGKAKNFRAQLGGAGTDLGAKFDKAWNSGKMKDMEKILVEANAKGIIDPAAIENMQKAFENEKLRQAGGPLNLASATKGAGMRSTMAIMEAEVRTLTGNQGKITGINEQVAEMRGWSQEQIEAFNSYTRTMDLFTTSLETYGSTQSKSMDEALKQIIADESKGKLKADGVTAKDMASATKDQIERAAELSNNEIKKDNEIIDYAAMQVSATESVADKLENVIAFLLEKLYDVMQPMLNLLDDLWSWITGSKDQQEAIKEIKKLRDAGAGRYEDEAAKLRKEAEGVKDPKEKAKLLEEAGKQSALAEETKIFSNKFTEQIQSGKNRGDIAKEMIDKQTLVDNREEIVKFLAKQKTTYGGKFGDSDVLQRFKTSEDPKDLERIYEKLGESKDFASFMSQLGASQVKRMGPSKEAADAANYHGATRRPGAQTPEQIKNHREAQEKADRPDQVRIEDLAAGQTSIHGSSSLLSEQVKTEQIIADGVATGVESATSTSYGLPMSTEASGDIVTPLGLPMATEASGDYGTGTGSRHAPGGAATSTGSSVKVDKKNVEVSEKNVEVSLSSVDLLGAIKTATESINVQAMGISMHLDDVKKFMKGPGIHLNKGKTKTEVIDGAMRPMLDELLTSHLTYLLMGILVGLDEEKRNALFDEMSSGKLLAGGVTHKVLGSQDWAKTKGEVIAGKTLSAPGPVTGGSRDFGGEIMQTGSYRLQRGEYVTSRNDVGKTPTVVNVNIVVNDASDPRAIANAISHKIYELSQKQ